LIVIEERIMPEYTYRREDGTTFTLRQKFTDSALTTDPNTGQKVWRVVQNAGVIFKGSGFYVNDSKGSSKSTLTNKTNGNGEKSATGEKSAEKADTSSSSSDAPKSESSSTSTATEKSASTTKSISTSE
jgi:predicted nucleic acid-binding Zn ribbon protein